MKAMNFNSKFACASICVCFCSHVKLLWAKGHKQYGQNSTMHFMNQTNAMKAFLVRLGNMVVFNLCTCTRMYLRACEGVLILYVWDVRASVVVCAGAVC